ncbi:MAG TPA: short-chain dehydrogenase, partial [Candidatus Thermoplasmatota archaeon]|nr:short-chain dehydrogenase [Candidatus Thermoplasmatota archaeon]
PAEGADTVVYLASSRDVEGVTGSYFIQRRPATSNSRARDEESARRLWEISEELTAPRPSG